MKTKISKKGLQKFTTDLNVKKKPSRHFGILIAILALSIFASLNILAASFFKGQISYISVPSQTKMNAFLSAGTHAPDFILSNLTNGKISSQNFIGEPFVIIFWNSWNHLSVEELKIADDYLVGPSDNKIKILAIDNQEDQNLVRSFINRGGYKIPIALDMNGGVSDLYGAHYLPVIYFVDKYGIIRDSFVGSLDTAGFLKKIVELKQ